MCEHPSFQLGVCLPIIDFYPVWLSSSLAMALTSHIHQLTYVPVLWPLSVSEEMPFSPCSGFDFSHWAVSHLATFLTPWFWHLMPGHLSSITWMSYSPCLGPAISCQVSPHFALPLVDPLLTLLGSDICFDRELLSIPTTDTYLVLPLLIILR